MKKTIKFIIGIIIGIFMIPAIYALGMTAIATLFGILANPKVMLVLLGIFGVLALPGMVIMHFIKR